MIGGKQYTVKWTEEQTQWIAEDGSGRVRTVRTNFRYPNAASRDYYGKHPDEIPTGGASKGESHEATAQRELREEAGYEAERLTELCIYDTSKSIMDERCWIYLGEGLRPVPARPDETEFFEIRAFPFVEVLRMVETSEIKDSMTVVAVLHAARRFGR